jgi:hypothetical protein
MEASLKGAKRVGKKRAALSKTEARQKGEFGAFALHLNKLLSDRSWSVQDFTERCAAHGLTLDDQAVRAWLRAENMPKSHMLRDLGKVLGLKDPRHILPE